MKCGVMSTVHIAYDMIRVGMLWTVETLDSSFASECV